MYDTQAVRRKIVSAILAAEYSLDSEWTSFLRRTYEILTDSNTSAFQREMLSACDEKFLLNVKDEVLGLEVVCEGKQNMQ